MTDKPTLALTRKELYRRVWSEPLTAVAKDVGVSGNALAKICNRLLVPYPARGYWVKVAAGKKVSRDPLPPAPDKMSNEIVFSPERVSSRRTRTRLDKTTRREQLLQVAEELVTKHGLHSATMKRIAATAGISETLAYNYFRTRAELLGELARREFARIREAREAEVARSGDHDEVITRITRAYLRHIGQRGRYLQTILSSSEVRTLLRAENRAKSHTYVHAHAQQLVELYGVSKSVALATTVMLTTLCLRAGKIVADGRVPEGTVERLCLKLMLQGSRSVIRGQTLGPARSAR